MNAPKKTCLLALSVLGALLPEVAAACAVCTGGSTEEVRYAFLWTTGFLSALPLVLVGGVVWFLRRRMRELEARSAAPEAPPLPLGRSQTTI
jgi:hypothetical protein